MIHSKNHNVCAGVTLVEVMLTMFLLGSLLTAMMRLQYSMFTQMLTVSDRLQRIFVMERIVHEMSLARLLGKKIENQQEIQVPLTKISYNTGQVQKKSDLQGFDFIVIDVLQGDWQSFTGKDTIKLYTLRYEMPPNKEKKP